MDRTQIIVRFVESFRKRSCEVKCFESWFLKFALSFKLLQFLSQVFVRILSVWIFPVLIFLFYWYLNLCLAREFTFRLTGISALVLILPLFLLSNQRF